MHITEIINRLHPVDDSDFSNLPQPVEDFLSIGNKARMIYGIWECREKIIILHGIQSWNGKYGERF